MKDKNKNQGKLMGFLRTSASNELTDELLMAYVDGELEDPNMKQVIEESPILKERAAAFISTRQLLNSLRTGVLDEPPPESMTDVVREGIAAHDQGRSLLHDLEIMAAVDGEVGFGGEAVGSSENQGETTKMFSWTGAQLRKLRTGVLQEPVPEDMLRVVEEALKKKEKQATQAPTLEIQKPVIGFFDRIVSWGSQLGSSAVLDYRLVGVAATAILAVGLYITAPFQAPSWETRFERLGLEQNFATDSWVANAENIFEVFTLPSTPGLTMRSANDQPPAVTLGSSTVVISDLEAVLDQMVDGMSNRGLLELPDEQQFRIFLRAITTLDSTPGIAMQIDPDFSGESELELLPPEGIEPACVVGELVDGSTVNSELVIESMFFSFCPLASNSRLTFLE
jgi:hypothetical protein